MNMRPVSILVLALFLLPFSPVSAQSPHRTIAITVDDLPGSSAEHMTAAEVTEMTQKIVSTLKAHNVPAVGFVNEKKLYVPGETDARIASLNIWLDAGMDLGNHTFAHTSLDRVPLPVWEEEVVRGETVTRILLARHGKKMRYFRHPYLDVGRDIQTRTEAENFLIQRGYTIAPVTMDAWDWAFSGLYADARRRNDSELLKQLTDAYLAYTSQVFDYGEKLSKDLAGYEPPQVLLLHGNWLEADHIGDLLDLLQKRGYSFVTLGDALSDSAYRLPDTYVGPEGPGWLEHWAITKGVIPQGAPQFPAWVLEKSRALPRPSADPVSVTPTPPL